MRLATAFLVGALVYANGPRWFCWTGSPSVAFASTFIELTVAELVGNSTLVACGTPIERTSVWEDSAGGRGRRIVTYTRVGVDRLIDGKADREIWVRTLGGVVGDLGQHVDGEAVLVSGQPALMFLAARPDGTHTVVGMGQGHYPLETPSGQPIRLAASGGLGHLLGKVGAVSSEPPARMELLGRTVDEVAQRVVALRHAHAR